MPSLSIPTITIHSSPTLRLIIVINHSIHYNPSYLLLLPCAFVSTCISAIVHPIPTLYPDHRHRHHYQQPKYTTNLKTLYLQYIWRTWILFHTTHIVSTHTHITHITNQCLIRIWQLGYQFNFNQLFTYWLIGASIARRKSKMITTSLIRLLAFLTFWDSITLSQAQCNTPDPTCGGCIDATGPYCYPSELTYPTISGGVNDCCCQSEADCIVDRIFNDAGSTVLITGNCE